MPKLFEAGAAAMAMPRGVQQTIAEALTRLEIPGVDGHGDSDPAGAAETIPPPCRLPSDGATPAWLYLLPIEDLLGDPGAEISTRIPFETAETCWQAIHPRVAPEEYEEAAQALAALPASDADAQIDAIGTRWWPHCAAALTAAIADTRAARSRDLRGPAELLDHAETIAAALAVGAAIARLKRLLGEQPIPRLSPAQKAALRSELDRLVHTRGGGDVRVVVHVIAHRLENPAELFLAIGGLNLGVASVHGRVLSAAREDVILSRAAEQLAALDEPLLGAAGIGEAVERLEIAAEALAAGSDLEDHAASAAFLREIGRLQEAFGIRLGSRILPELWRRIGNVWRVAVPVEPPGPALIRGAEQAARAVARLSRSAALIGAESVSNPIAADILDTVTIAAGHAARALDAAEPEQRWGWAAMIVDAARIVEVLAGSDRAFALLAEHQARLDGVWEVRGDAAAPPRSAAAQPKPP